MTNEEKTVIIKLYCEEVPTMKISYTDKYDLFKQFKKNLKKYDFPTNEIYWYDWENVHTRMRTPDDVYIAVREGFAKMFVRDPEASKTFPNFSSDDEEEDNKVNERKERERSPSPTRIRGRSRSEPRHGAYSHVSYSEYPPPWNYRAWMDSVYLPSIPYYAYPESGRRRCVEKKCRHCEECEKLARI